MERNFHQITKENAMSYIDSICDGAIWYTVDAESAEILQVSPGALALLGYEREGQMFQDGWDNLWERLRLAETSRRNRELFDNFVVGRSTTLDMCMYVEDAHRRHVYFSFLSYPSPFYQQPGGGTVMIGQMRKVSTFDVLFQERRIWMDEMSNSIIVVRKEGYRYPLVYGNRFFCRLVQLEEEIFFESDGETELLDFVFESDRNKFVRAVDSCTEERIKKETYRFVNAEGNAFWQLSSHKRFSMGDDTYVVISCTNIQELMGMQAMLQKDNEKWINIVNLIPVGLMVIRIRDIGTDVIAINDRLIDFANELGKSLDGFSRSWNKEEMMMILNQNIYAFCLEEDFEKAQQMIEESRTGRYASTIFRLRGSDGGNIVYVRTASVCRKNELGEDICYVAFNDVTQEQLSKAELEKSHAELSISSRTDPLTGLSNRKAFNELREYMEQKAGNKTGVLFADVNGLKMVNDTYGHAYGDLMICRFANILRSEFGYHEVFRISGDEFVVVSQDVEQTAFEKQIEQVKEQVRNTEQIAAVGAMWQERLTNLDLVVSASEQLMYMEKQNYYKSGMQHDISHMQKLVALLKEGQ